MIPNVRDDVELKSQKMVGKNLWSEKESSSEHTTLIMSGKSLREHVRSLLEKNKAPIIVIDLHFCELLDPKEVKFLKKQIQQVYGRNMRCPKPVNLTVSSLTENTPIMEGLQKLTQDNLESWIIDWTPVHFLNYYHKSRKNLVYLTADCDEDLEVLAVDCIYIIGGIVDHNRLKGLTANFARGNGVKVRRLPISKYMETTSHSRVLAVNQVFDILLVWWNWGCWRKALEFSIPKRKGFYLKQPLRAEELGSVKFKQHVHERRTTIPFRLLPSLWPGLRLWNSWGIKASKYWGKRFSLLSRVFPLIDGGKKCLWRRTL